MFVSINLIEVAYHVYALFGVLKQIFASHGECVAWSSPIEEKILGLALFPATVCKALMVVVMLAALFLGIVRIDFAS